MSKLNESQTNIVNEAEGSGNKKFWGVFGSFWSRFINKDDTSKGNEDPITAELKRQEQDAANSAIAREKQLLDAKENAIAQKLAAKYEAKKNKATLANRRKIDAWNAKKAKAKAAADYWKNNKLERTQAEMDAWEKELDKSFTDLGSGGYDSDVERFNTSTYLVAWHEDGTMRTAEEIAVCQKAAEKAKNDQNYDPQQDSSLSADEKALLAKNANWREVAKHTQVLKDLTQKHQSEITDAIKDSELDMPKLLEGIQADAIKGETTKKDAEEAEEMAATFKRNKEAIVAVNQLNEQYEEAVEKKNTKKEEFDKYNTKGPYYDIDSATGKPKYQGGSDGLSSMVQSVLTDSSIASLTGDEKVNAIKKKLKELGIPQKSVDTVCEGLSSDLFTADSTDIPSILTDNIEKLTDSDLETIDNAVNTTLTTAYNQAKNDFESAERALDSMYNPNELLTSEQNQAWLENNADSPVAIQVQMVRNPDYKGPNGEEGIAQEDIDGEVYLNEATEKEIVDAAKAARKKADDAAVAEAARRQHIKEKQIQAKAAETEENLPQEIKDATEAETDKFGEGETICNEGDNKGKIGFYDENGVFHPKPDMDDIEERDKYIKERKRAIMLKPQQHPAKNITNISAEKDEDGKYTVTYVDDDGNEQTEKMTAQEVAIERANIKRNAENKSLSEQYKRNAADVITKKCMTDGKLDPEKIKALKDEDKDLYDAIVQLQKDGKLEAAYKGLEIGNTTWHSLKNAIGETDLSTFTGTTDTTQTNDTTQTPDDENEQEDEDQTDDEDVNDEVELDADDEDDDAEDDGNGKKKLKHPSQIYKRRTSKITHKKLKSYCRKDDPKVIISKAEYQKKVRSWNERKNKKNNTGGQAQAQRSMGDSAIDYTNLKNWLFERLMDQI